MMLKKWEQLPDFMRTPEVKPYWEVLHKKRGQLLFKRIFDFSIALILLVVLTIPMIIIALLIKCDSPGTVFYLQERVTSYGEHFRIHKFRTMISNADKMGTLVTVDNDARITKIGLVLRKLHLDELPQVIDVLLGNMSFVGARPEVPKYVEKYEKEYVATLLLPAGITSIASIEYKNESEQLKNTDDIDETYLKIILPQKMKWNLEYILQFGFAFDISVMFKTIIAVFGKGQQQ